MWKREILSVNTKKGIDHNMISTLNIRTSVRVMFQSLIIATGNLAAALDISYVHRSASLCGIVNSERE